MENNDELKQVEIDSKNSNIMFFMAFVTLFGVYITYVILYLLDGSLNCFGYAFSSSVYSSWVTVPIVLILYKYETIYYKNKEKNWIYIETSAMMIVFYLILIMMIKHSIFDLFYEYTVFLSIFIITQIVKYFVYKNYCKTILIKGDTNGK